MVLDAMLSPAPEGGAAVPERAQPDRDLDKFLKAAMEASPPGRRAGPKTPPWAGQRNPVRPRLPQSPKRPTIRVSLIRWAFPPFRSSGAEGDPGGTEAAGGG